MSTAFERDGWDGGIQPSVSKDKWVRFALQKMERGYALIVSEERRSASFFLSGKGYEGCSFKVARQLMMDGLIVESGQHPLGRIYLLDPEALARLMQPPPKTPIHGRTRFEPDPDMHPGHGHGPPDAAEEMPEGDEVAE